MTSAREDPSKQVKLPILRTDTPTMSGRPTLLERLRAALLGPRDKRVLVLVNTTHGPRAVPVRARDLR